MTLVEEVLSGDPTGRMGLYVEWFVSIEMAIALAWLRRTPGSTVGVKHRAGRELHARYLRWADGGEGEEEEEGRIPGETWRPLRWRCGIVPCDERYEISNKGRLRSPHTNRVTNGFAYGDTRLAAVRGGGLVDLYRAARLRRDVSVPPRVMMAIDALQTGHGAHDLADAAGVEIGTAYTYMCQGATHVPAEKLRRIVSRLVSRDLWRVLRTMEEEGHPVLGGALLELVEEVLERVSPDGAFANTEFQMAELRLARLAIAAGGSTYK